MESFFHLSRSITLVIKSLIAALLICIGGCTNLTHVTKDCGLPDQATRQSIVFIASTGGSTASGVVIGKNLILTVAHAVDLTETLAVNVDGVFLKAETLLIDEQNDLALLSVGTNDLQPIPLSGSPLVVDEAVWALGFPLAKEQRLSLGLYKNEFNKRLYSTTHVNSGVSGGGLLRCSDGRFELAGVIHGFVAQVEGDNYINIGDSTSVPAATIESFIHHKKDGLALNLPTASHPDSHNL